MVKINSYQLLKSLREQLIKSFPSEAEALAFRLVAHFSSYSQTDIVMDKPFTTGPQFNQQIKSIINRLIGNEPIQYILREAPFYNRVFEVNPSTLIPRQETEELVHLVLKDIKNKHSLTIIDIGTGTGCIPITLKLENNSHKIQGIDCSLKAIATAKRNALNLNASVNFTVLDILNSQLTSAYNVIISNPPYVLESEKMLMKANVLEHEPASALFVPNDNPLLFYKRITELATKHLNHYGLLYFEINEHLGTEVVLLLKSSSFSEVKLHQDLNGKDRFVSGVLG